VPRLRRLPVGSLFFREYRRYSPDLSLRIIVSVLLKKRMRGRKLRRQFGGMGLKAE
jgi:hypothetical protein